MEDPGERRSAGVWSPERRPLTVGLLLTVTLVALEALAVATVMPEVRADLGGYALYGWVFSGFFLASILGVLVGGPVADRRGPVVPFVVGLALFSLGLAVAGFAGSMAMLVVGRVLQGLGAGAVPAASYAAIGRVFTAAERPRMFALLSTAWVVPGLVGPAAAAWVEQSLSWRWVFLGLLPVVAVAGALTTRPLAVLGGHGPPDPGVGSAVGRGDRPMRIAVLMVGVTGVLVALGDVAPVLAAVVLAVGLPATVWGFVGLVPAGTLRLAPGVPATVAVRGLLTWSFFQADAYVSLAVVDGRESSTFMAGAALSVASVVWAVGSWVQARHIHRVGPRVLVAGGFGLILVGVGLCLLVALGAAVWVVVPAWALAGLGMGLAYSPLSVVVLAEATPGEEGTASAALQLSDLLGIAVGTGIGGGVVALADARGSTVAAATAVVFALALAVGVVGALASRRLPATV